MEYPGCVLVTSHDRWFLDRLATHILAYEGDSRVVWFEGNYEEYEKDKKRRLGDDAANRTGLNTNRCTANPKAPQRGALLLSPQ